MSETVGEVKIALKLDSSGLNTGAGSKLGSAFGSAWTVAAGNLVSAGLSALMATAVKVGKEIISTGMAYEKAMSEVKAISGATGEEFDKLSAKALSAAKNTIFTSSEVASAYKYMAMAGWDAEEMMEGLDGILNLAAASNLDLARTSDIVTDALTAFGYEARQSGHFADVLAQTATNANTNVDLMGESFKYVGAIAGTMKYSIEDVGVALGLMANSGIKASQAGTSLRSIISRMAAPTDKVKAAMDELGISMKNADGTAKPFSEVMVQLRQKFKNLSDTQKTQVASTIAGKNAMTGLLAIVNASDEDFEKLTSAIGDSENAAQDMADTMKDNLSGDVTELNSKLDVLYVNLYQKIEPALRGIVGFLSSAVDVIATITDSIFSATDAISQNEIAMGILNGAITGITAVAGGFIGVWAEVKLLFDNVGQIVDTVSQKFEWIKGVFGGVVGSVQGFVGSVGAAFSSMKDSITSTISNIWNSVSEWVGNMVKSAVEMGSQFLSAVVNFFSQLPGKLGEFISMAFTKVVEWGQNMVTKAQEVGSNVLSAIVTFFSQLPGNVWNFLSQTLTKFAGFAKNIWDKAKEAAKNVFNAIVDTIAKIPGEMLTIGGNIVEGLWNGINGAVGWLKDKVTSFASSVLDSIKSAFGIGSPSKLFRDQVGVFLAQGVGVGFIKEVESVASDMQEALADNFGVALGLGMPSLDIPEPDFRTTVTSLAEFAMMAGEEDEPMETAPQPLFVTLEMDGQQIQQVILQDIRRSA